MSRLTFLFYVEGNLIEIHLNLFWMKRGPDNWIGKKMAAGNLRMHLEEEENPHKHGRATPRLPFAPISPLRKSLLSVAEGVPNSPWDLLIVSNVVDCSRPQTLFWQNLSKVGEPNSRSPAHDDQVLPQVFPPFDAPKASLSAPGTARLHWRSTP
ncbi:hypothetical protein NDU88_001605 [Pleurodeles waltl]|uniref:Uncharacterized protein n=1 Tax=Pleurodeles waltl TaxID=8319 RepID=A0AAV7VZQ3_PLEWA|nr:hypothetical protein NDU88_001605 [Pleurodeles waltl]